MAHGIPMMANMTVAVVTERTNKADNNEAAMIS